MTAITRLVDKKVQNTDKILIVVMMMMTMTMMTQSNLIVENVPVPLLA